MAVLIEKIKQAIAAAEMLDAVEFAQELIDETRRLGLQDTYYVAEMLSLICRPATNRLQTGFADI